MKFDFQKNLAERLAKPEYNTEINLDDIVDKMDYPTTPPQLKDLKKYIHVFSKETLAMETVLTQQQMFEDLAQFQFLIQYIYSGYKVLGVTFFENAFKKLSDFIEKTPQSTKEEFANQINLSLEGLNDNHFSIIPCKGVRLRPLSIQGKQKTYLNSTFNITKKDSAYYIDDKKIVAINDNQNIDTFINKVCSVDGKIKYGFVVRENEKAGTVINLIILLEDKTKIVANLPQKKFNQLQHHDNGFIKKIKNCIYIRNTACMLHTQDEDNELQEFSKIIKNNIDNVDFAIIDARCNWGGADTFNSTIHKSILSMKHFQNGIGLIHFCARHIWNYESSIKTDEQYAEHIYKTYQDSINAGTPNIKEIKVRKQENSPHNNKTIFVLVDERSVSAGEEYNKQLASFANVVFLNDNTAGMRHFGNIANYFLNNSDIKINLATSYFSNGKCNIENKGFPPDVYFDCEPDEILTTLENFINNNTNFKCPSLKPLQRYDHESFEIEKSK